MQKALMIGITTMVLAVAGCSDDAAPPLTGRFVDAPVAGLNYTGSTGIAGVTGSDGSFSYEAGSEISFSAGGVVFPRVSAAALLTPLDLAGAASADDSGAVAIARFIQSLDADGNPDNGIVIDRTKVVASARAPERWQEASEDSLKALLASGVTLRDEVRSRQHLRTQFGLASGHPRMSIVGRYSSGGTPATPSLVAEILAYHAGSKSLFVTCDTSAEPSSFKRIDLGSLGTTVLANPRTATNLTVAATTSVAKDVDGDGFKAGGVQSLDIVGDLLAIAVQASNKTDNGVIAFYRLDNRGAAVFLRKVTVGSLPDGVAFSPDGRFLVVANEGELSNSFLSDGIDPEGSISIIRITSGAPENTALTLHFRDFNVGGSRHAELPRQVRIGRSGATVAQDLEPEYVAVSDDSKTAYVTLQENNAVAVVDLESQRISRIIALGVKDFGGRSRLAASDRYAGTTSAAWNNPANAPELKTYRNLFGVYMPDGIAAFTVGGKSYFITANEGDDRDDFLTNFGADSSKAETLRFSQLPQDSLDRTAFPADVLSRIRTDQELGRLTLMARDAAGRFGDTDGDGDYDRVYMLGARSFSIWDAQDGSLVFDSGDEMERIVYNDASEDTPNRLNLLKAAQLLGRLDNKGPEPESVVVGRIGQELYAFVGLERSSGILMVHISNPARPKVVQYLRNTSDLSDGDISPEGLKFIAADKSPTGVPLLVVGHEVTGSVPVLQIR